MKYINAVILLLLSTTSLAALMLFGEMLDYSIVGILINYAPSFCTLIVLHIMAFNSKKSILLIYTVTSVILYLSIRFPTMYGLSLMLNSILYAKSLMMLWFIIILIPSFKLFKGQFDFKTELKDFEF